MTAWRKITIKRELNLLKFGFKKKRKKPTAIKKKWRIKVKIVKLKTAH